MRRLFDSYIIVDWSAASKPQTGENSIWIGVLMPDARLKLQFSAINPSTRAEAVDQLQNAISRLLKRGDRILLGFDFPFGYPWGTARALNLGETNPPWQAMHAFLTKEMKDKPDNTNNRFPLASRMNRRMSEGPFPFWGVPAKSVTTTLTSKKSRDHGADDLSESRIAERHSHSKGLGRAQPVWKLYGNGSAGSQALTGIPRVQAMRQSFANESAIWPYETGWFEPGENDELPQLLMAEIYPSILKIKPVPGRTKDETQVESLSRWFAEKDAKGELAKLLSRPEGIEEAESQQILAEEGWILGI